MRLINETPFEFGYLAGRLGHPRHSMTLVAKGTFRLVASRRAVPAEEQAHLRGDDPDEDEGPRSLRYPLDLVPFKPRADLLLVGRCHTGAAPTARCRVVFTVGAFTKALTVVGDRVWTIDGTASEPKPFTEMDLTYERSFGGPGWPANPVGSGLAMASAPPGPPPNIEEPSQPTVFSGQRVAPAGFGPLRRSWSPRAEKVGTYDDVWRRERWPWFPADFDFGHFNAAPVDMQVPYLRGDEPLRFENLHPTATVFESALPAVRVRCLVRAPAATAGDPREVTMVIDTLWVDMETQTLVLLWRGVVDVPSQDEDEALGAILLSSETMNEPPASGGTLARRMAEALDRKPPAPVEETIPLPKDAEGAARKEAAFEEAMAAANEKTRRTLADAGIDPDHLPKPTEAQKRAHIARLAELGFTDDEKPAPLPRWTRERVAAAAGAGESLAGSDLAGLDLSDLDLTSADLTEADLTGATLCRTNAPKAKLERAQLHRADLSGANFDGASLAEADLTQATLTQASFAEAILERAIAERAVFRQSRLKGARAKGLRARGADFTGAICSNADFAGANLSDTCLTGADFQRAGLRGASMNGAQGENIDAREADLTELRASERAAFPNARFDGARGDRANFVGASLSGSDLSFSSFERADFSRSTLDGARLVGANLKHAQFSRASLKGAVLVRANLFQANLERTNLAGANLTDASLYGAETWDADMSGVVLTGANVKATKLAGPVE